MERVEKPPSTEALPPPRPGRWPLGIFVKEPRPGEVKTRLVPPLTPEAAAALYATALQETVQRFSAGPFALTLFCSGGEAFFRRHFPALPRRPQQGDALGERLQHALASLLEAGPQRAGIIGSDSPDLPLPMVADAFAALDRADAVTIPARDGGYVFIGMTRLVPELFVEIPWSSPGVAQATRRQAARAGVRYLELGGWDDIDDLAALQRLQQRSPASRTARHAADWLQQPAELTR